jgi:hypothetical protein
MWKRAAGHFALRCVPNAIRVKASWHAALAGGIGELSMIQAGGGLCRLRLGAYAGSGRLPMVIVLRRLDFGATVKGREALPHGHCVADCPPSGPLVGLPNQAVLAESERVREHILTAPSRRDAGRPREQK